MCGIAGLISKNTLKPADIETLGKMNTTLYHRGPDSMGFYQNTNIVLAMRRLKIIDLTGGDQPLYNEDGSGVLIANGGRCGGIGPRDVPGKTGHRFKTH